jgi:adenylate kinase
MEKQTGKSSKHGPLPAMLLLGPTGSGKTPLGEALERNGVAGRGCHHFDFGACFRKAVGDGPGGHLSESDLSIIRKSIATGALLKDSEFHVARKILESFLLKSRIGPEEWIVLNGLPRHEGQAKGIEGIAEVRSVVSLDCRDEVVLERLMRDPAGDRKGRTDDGDELVLNKLKKFRDMTLPLVDYYARSGVRVIRISVTPVMTAESMREIVDSQLESVSQ